MNYKEHTRLDLVAGGNVFKQGDHMTLGFTPRDYEGDVVDLTGKDIEGVIYSKRKGIMYTAPAEYIAADQKIEFTIDEVLDHGQFQVEFTATDAADPDYRRKFPSGEQDGKLIIKLSSENMDVVGVKMTTVSQLKNELQVLQNDFAGQVLPRVDTVEGKQTQLETQFTDVVSGVTDDAEILSARTGPDGTYQTIGQRMDATTMQLEETTQQVTDIAYSVKLFGATGDGIADDTIALTNALKSGYRIYFPRGTYRITEQITVSATGNIVVSGDNANILFDSPVHKEYAIRYSGYGVKYDISGIVIDGKKMCNKALEILSNTPSMERENLSLLLLTDVSVKNVKRLNTFSGGSGVAVRGGFFLTKFSRVFVNNCELPQGQGTAGTVGIAGIAVTHYGFTGYSKKTIFSNVELEKVYSSDLTYEGDQDGITCFSPLDSTGSMYRSELIVENSTFTNCYGRSIKSQVFINQVDNCSFERSEGFASKRGNGEINTQASGGKVSGCTFIYQNGYQPGACVSVSSANAGTPSSMVVENCEVYADSMTILDGFFGNSSSDGNPFGRLDIKSVKIYGGCRRLADYRVTGNKNFMTVKDCYIQKLELGVTSELALVYISAHGNVSPYYGHLVIEGTTYAGSEKPALVRDQIPLVATNSKVSAFNNTGFADESGRISNEVLDKTQAARIGKMSTSFDGEGEKAGYFEIKTFVLAAGETKEMRVNNATATLIYLISSTNANSYAIFSSSHSTNSTLFKGSLFEVGQNSEPASGLFRTWSAGANKLMVKNTDASARTFSIFEMSPT